MKIYRLTQEEARGYDTYDSCIVCAENEELAKKIHPEYDRFETGEFCVWAKDPQNVKAEYLGEAREGSVEGVYLASFHAG